MKTVALLLSARRHPERLLACLEECFRQGEALAADGRFAVTAWFADRGETEALSQQAAARFPQLRIVRSEPGPWWCQGLRTAWKAASEEDYDFYIWVDSELELAENALFSLLDNSGFLKHLALIAGSVYDGEGTLRFGGRTRNRRLLKPDPVIPVPCEVFDGMLVLVPKAVFGRLGLPDEHYRQGFGDYDYGIRAARAGIVRVIAPGLTARTRRRPYRGLLRENFRYDRRSAGLFTALWNALKMYVKQLFTRNEQV